MTAVNADRLSESQPGAWFVCTRVLDETRGKGVDM
jgi:hypothetical protein